MRNNILKSRAASIVAAGVLTASIVGGVAYAAVPDSSGVYSGCYQKNSGALRVIDPSSESCKSNEILITWNRVGPAGAQGPVGPAGPQGVPGPQGTPGPGSVTQVNTGAGLTGGPITTSGTISVAPGGITTGLLAPGAATQAASVSEHPWVSTSATSPADLPGLSTTLTTTGGPVLLMFSGSFVGRLAPACCETGYWQIVREDNPSRPIAINNQDFLNSGHWLTVSLMGLDSPPAGTYTYKVQWWLSTQPGATMTASENVYSQNFIAVELKR